MNGKKISRRATVLVVALAVISVASVAFAAWTATGTGNGTAGATSALGLSLSGATASDLYPGATVDMTVTITNPNPYPVHVTQLAAGVAAPSATGAGCTLTGVTLNGPFTVDVTVPAKLGLVDGSNTAALTGAVSATNAILDACQGQTFTFPLKISAGASAA